MKHKLSEIAELITKGTTPKTYCEAGNDSVVFLRAENIDGGIVGFSNFKYVTNDVHTGFLKRSILEKNDLLITIAGTLARVAMVSDDILPANTNQAIALVRIRNSKYNPKYVYYYLLQDRVRESLNVLSSQSAQPNLNLKQIGDIELDFPSIEEQNRIVETLECFDKKISNNTKINEELNNYLSLCFMDALKSSGGKKGYFADLIINTLSGDWGKEKSEGNNTQEVYCIRGADIPEVKNGNKGKMPKRYILPKNYLKKKLEPGDLVVEISGGSPTQSTGRICLITENLIDRYDSPIVCTNFCKAIEPKKHYSHYIYQYWQYLYDKGVFFTYENGTTGIKNLDIQGIINKEEIIIPSDECILHFESVSSEILSKIIQNSIENEELIKTRNTINKELYKIEEE